MNTSEPPAVVDFPRQVLHGAALAQARAHSPTVLLLPDWQASKQGACSEVKTWQDRWAQSHAYRVLAQDDWQRPRRGDWLARLNDAVVDTPGPLVLVAHGLACHLVAAWASFSGHTAKVRGALLVLPCDLTGPAMKNKLPGWVPAVRLPLPFRCMVVSPAPEPGASAPHAQGLVQDWAAEWPGAQPPADSCSPCDWPQGHALLQTLLKE